MHTCVQKEPTWSNFSQENNNTNMRTRCFNEPNVYFAHTFAPTALWQTSMTSNTRLEVSLHDHLIYVMESKINLEEQDEEPQSIVR